MKTFAFILYIVFHDGSEHRAVLDSGITASDCVERLVSAERLVKLDMTKFKHARNVIVSCEQEKEI